MMRYIFIPQYTVPKDRFILSVKLGRSVCHNLKQRLGSLSGDSFEFFWSSRSFVFISAESVLGTSSLHDINTAIV